MLTRRPPAEQTHRSVAVFPRRTQYPLLILILAVGAAAARRPVRLLGQRRRRRGALHLSSSELVHACVLERKEWKNEAPEVTRKTSTC